MKRVAVRIVMIGPPGAGKGTQARRLERREEVPQISTGDMLRDAEAAGTELGRAAARYMLAGQLVPDDVVIGIVEERLAAPDCERGFVLDGFPRTVEQAGALDGMLAKRGVSLDAAISVEVPRDEVVRRLSGRLGCNGCGALFHRDSRPPAVPGVCDECGGVLRQRDDDREDRIALRLETMAQETAPVLAYYEETGLLRPIDGCGSEDEVFARIEAALA